MSTIADYSVFTKAFLASGMTDFSQLYGKQFQGEEAEGTFRAFAVIPFNLEAPLTPREAMNFDTNNFKANHRFGENVNFSGTSTKNLVSCRDADGKFIGNIVRVQPGERKGSIRFVAKVAVPVVASSEGDEVDTTDAQFNTFVLVRTDASTGMNLPIAVATISNGYNLHRHLASENDPLDDVENANYVSFTINHLNGYTSVDFNPDAYATYDDVANALSRGIDGLHIAFDTASGDLKLLDKDGNVLDQANLPIKADVIIAEGEEGYKYVKTDVKQDIHAAKAWMPEDKTAWEAVEAVPYTRKHAALVVGKGSSRVFESTKPVFTAPVSTKDVSLEHVVIDDSTYMLVNKTETVCTLRKVKGKAEAELEISAGISGGKVILESPSNQSNQYTIANGKVEVDVIEYEGVTCVLVGPEGPGWFKAQPISGELVGQYHDAYSGTITTNEDPSTGGVVGITLDGQSMYTFEEGATTPSEFKDHSGHDVTWFGTKTIPEGYTLKYGLEAFVWTVKGEEVEISDPFFSQLNNSLLALGFHEGDDIALGTNLAKLSTDLNKVDAGKYMHGKDNKATREQEVNTQRAYAKEELAAWNAQHPGLEEDRSNGTIIDHTGLDVRNGSITLGCGSVGEAGVYGIQMKKSSGSLDFTISHTTGNVQFDDNGHAANLTRSTLLSVEAGSYISGAPTCLILAEVTHNSENESVVFTPVRVTAGFSVEQSYDVSNGLTLTLHDYRDNIKAILNPDGHTETAPSIIEVQAIYTHRNARNETVPAQQMHTYIGKWDYNQAPTCSFLCNKIEEWMTAVGLTDTNSNPAENVKLYVVIRVY